MDKRLYYAIGYRDAQANLCMMARSEGPNQAVRQTADQLLSIDPDHCHAKAVLARIDNWVLLSQATLEFCRDALIKQIEATYDESAICDQGVKHGILRACAIDLGVDFDKVISTSVPVSARQRLAKALQEEIDKSTL